MSEGAHHAACGCGPHGEARASWSVGVKPVDRTGDAAVESKRHFAWPRRAWLLSACPVPGNAGEGSDLRLGHAERTRVRRVGPVSAVSRTVRIEVSVSEDRYDVAILGSGIGGSMLACILAKHGVKTLLLEGAVHPRFTIGESLIPETGIRLRIIGEKYGVPEIGWIGAFHQLRDKVSSNCGVKRSFSFMYHSEGQQHRAERGQPAADPDPADRPGLAPVPPGRRRLPGRAVDPVRRALPPGHPHRGHQVRRGRGGAARRRRRQLQGQVPHRRLRDALDGLRPAGAARRDAALHAPTPGRSTRT